MQDSYLNDKRMVKNVENKITQKKWSKLYAEWIRLNVCVALDGHRREGSCVSAKFRHNLDSAYFFYGKTLNHGRMVGNVATKIHIIPDMK